MKIKYFSTISESLGKDEEIIKEKFQSLSELLKHLSKKYGSRFSKKIYLGNDLNKYYLVLIDGERAGLDSKVRKDSTVVIMPVISGG